MQYYQVAVIGLEIQIGQLLFNCASSGFSNAAVYVIWYVSSSLCCSGVHLSRLAVRVLAFKLCHEGADAGACISQMQVQEV